MRSSAGVLRVFLRYAHREGLLARDLSGAVGWPQVYRLATLPRSISWEDVNKVLAGVDRRTPGGRRDYAILLLLVVYGLRGREIAALTLDDIDWKRERLAIPERKAGHSTAFPLTATVGEALVAYLKDGRPETEDRHVFFRANAPLRPIGPAAVSGRARHYLLKAGIEVPRPGSHTLRHTTVQRLVDADFDLKTIGDFIGHRSSCVDRGLCQGGRRGPARGGPGRRRGGAGMTGDLAPAVAHYLAHKRALGRKFHGEEKSLDLLVAFCEAQGLERVDQLDPVFLDAFFSSRPRPRPRSFNNLVGIVGCFLRWAVDQELVAASPLRTEPAPPELGPDPVPVRSFPGASAPDGCCCFAGQLESPKLAVPPITSSSLSVMGSDYERVRRADFESATSTPVVSFSSFEGASSARAVWSPMVLASASYWAEQARALWQISR